MRRSWLLELLGAGGVPGSVVIAGVLYLSGGEGDPAHRDLRKKVCVGFDPAKDETDPGARPREWRITI
jgi:hypothetical protein